LPVPAYNEFNQLFDSLKAVGLETVIPFKTVEIQPGELTSENWPVQPGNYRVFSPFQSTAIALLQGISLGDLTGIGLNGVAIIGSISTENIGIEHLVKNIISNPYIRTLVLFGRDIEGHKPGNALIHLLENGLNSQNKIIGAQGARPVLKNLTKAEVDHFRAQIKISNLIGQTELSSLTTFLTDLNQQDFSPYEPGLKIDLVEARRAEPARRLKLDHVGYFVIMVRQGREQPIWVEHYTNDGALRNVIEGKDAASICATVIDLKLVSQLDHAAYLGRELAKAELSQSLEVPYIQDKAQGFTEGNASGQPSGTNRSSGL
jgi:tetrahydromethanopterin S-methyltransferase subunit A